MLSSKILTFLGLFKARLSRRIVFWIFTSIVFIEAIILVPSYWAEERRQLNNLENISEATVESIKTLGKNEKSDSRKFKEQLRTIIEESEVVRGIAIYTIDGELQAILGEPPELSFADINDPNLMIKREQYKNRYDVAWSPDAIGNNYMLVIRHDSSSIKGQLNQFIIRIAFLVLIISVFVTIVTMIVLGTAVIIPILRLRDDLKNAGEALSQDRTDCEFYALSSQRQDELGEVMQAFGEMFNRVSWEIGERKRTAEKLSIEKAKSEELLLNILPEPIANLLKEKQCTIAQAFSEVSILFADIVGFTQLSSSIAPEDLVNFLNQIFSAFDRLTEKHNLEKIKTIGDSYMVAAGLPLPHPNHAEAIAEMALDMQAEIKKLPQLRETKICIRIGINTGPVVAGVIGTKKFIYDLWGDSVNTASRMESHGLPGCIQVTETTYRLLHDKYLFIERGYLDIKGKGKMQTYLLTGRKDINRK